MVSLRTIAACLILSAAACVPARGEDGADKARALEERIRQLEAENRRLRALVPDAGATEPGKAETDDVVPEDGWLFQPDPAERRRNHPEDAWTGATTPAGVDAARGLRDQLYVKDIVSDAGC